MTVLEKYFFKWKLMIDIEKTELIIFSHKERDKVVPKLHMYNEEVEHKRQAKYLGVILDPTLTFTKHFVEARKKTFKAIGSMYSLICRKSKMSLSNKLIIYKMIIRPTMLYAAPMWGSTYKTNINKLQIAQNKCLRMATDAKPGTRLLDIHQKLEIPTIKDEIDRIPKNCYEKINELELLSEICKIKYNKALFKVIYKLPYHLLQ